MFDEKLGKYALSTFKRQRVDVRTSHRILELRPGVPKNENEENTDDVADHGCYTLTTEQNGDIGIGMCVWSTGRSIQFPF